MEEEINAPRSESVYALEGTAAHALGELEARRQILNEFAGTHGFAQAKKAWREEFAAVLDDAVVAEMDKHMKDYVRLIRKALKKFPDSVLMLEERVETGIETCSGTADVVIVSPRHVEIIDLKYGAGVPVGAHENSQLMLYGVGALETFGDLVGETETVLMTIFQPRLDSTSTFEMTAPELREWRDTVAIIGAAALDPDPTVAWFGPSESACRWCPAKGQCRAQLEAATQEDFGTPYEEPVTRSADLLNPQEIADALSRLPMIKTWVSSVEDAALDQAYSGGMQIPGWKVVLSGGKRVVSNQDAALEALFAAGKEFDQVAKKTIRGIGELEKLLGKKDFDTLVTPFVTKTTGRPSLAPDSDKRAAISPSSGAVEDFS
jgi:hypothetical protein